MKNLRSDAVCIVLVSAICGAVAIGGVFGLVLGWLAGLSLAVFCRGD